MKIAIEGCMHGELDKVYETLQRLEKEENTKIDLLLCCGDFQAVRNENDLTSMSVPPKFRSMNSFWKYYSGQAKAPYPTIFIGGNHEASNYMWELYYGGWAAPDIFFMGFAGVVKFGNIRIGGLSGIYQQRDYSRGHYERPPYNKNDIKSVYHVREYEVFKLKQIEEPIDIFLSHDWPLGITEYGDWEKLISQKPFFKGEVERRALGSKPAAELLSKLKPPYWFSAHLHCRFPAVIQHGENGPVTRFLALDKCIRGRNFLQIVEIESDPGPYEIQYDEEWLAITRKFNCFFPLSRKSFDHRNATSDNQDHRQWMRTKLNIRGAKPFDFVKTVPSYDPSVTDSSRSFKGHCRNPQTESLMNFLELPYLLDDTTEASTPIHNTESVNSTDFHNNNYHDEDSIDIDDVDELEESEEVENEDT